MNARDVMRYGHGTVLASVEGLDESDWLESGVCGVWSVRDIIAHLASYELVLVDVLRSMTTDGPTPHLDEFLWLGPDFNDEAVERRHGFSVADTVSEYTDAYELVAEAGAKLAPEQWREPGTLLWYGEEYSLDDLVVYQYYGHKREHCAQIAVYRDLLASRRRVRDSSLTPG